MSCVGKADVDDVDSGLEESVERSGQDPALCLAEDLGDPPRALARYESHRIARTRRLQEVSHARAHVNHLPDGPEQITERVGIASSSRDRA